MKRYLFPFTAIVGQEKMKRALILNAVDPRIGGVLIMGERGTAKSTAARALAKLLPEQKVIQGCRFGCDPNDPAHRCEECSSKYGSASDIPFITRATPFVDLPVSATEDRLVGTIDFEKALTDGKKHFDPGIFAAANRGFLYVDEINLLDDHIVDTLLDAAAMGMNFVEREGISFSHPAKFIIIGTMNPEEGELRPQLLDRFAHSVKVAGTTDADERVTIMERCVAFEEDPEAFCESFAAGESALCAKIISAQERLHSVQYTKDDLNAIADLTVNFGLEGHRADLVILKTAKANAAFNGRGRLTAEDISIAAELAVPHRLVNDHTVNSAVKPEEVHDKIASILDQHSTNLVSPEEVGTEAGDDKKKLLS